MYRSGRAWDWESQDLADFSSLHYVGWAGAVAVEPFCEIADADGVLDGDALHGDSDRVRGAADASDPLVALKLFQCECDGFEERRGGDFDRVGDALHVGNGDATGAEFHGEEVIIFAFCSPLGFGSAKLDLLKKCYASRSPFTQGRIFVASSSNDPVRIVL